MRDLLYRRAFENRLLKWSERLGRQDKRVKYRKVSNLSRVAEPEISIGDEGRISVLSTTESMSSQYGDNFSLIYYPASREGTEIYAS